MTIIATLVKLEKDATAAGHTLLVKLEDGIHSVEVIANGDLGKIQAEAHDAAVKAQSAVTAAAAAFERAKARYEAIAKAAALPTQAAAPVSAPAAAA
jgi:hypothetical protein